MYVTGVASMKESSPRITSEIAQKTFRYQLRVSVTLSWIIALIMILILVLLSPTLKAFFQGGPQIWYLTLLKLSVIVPGVLLVVASAYFGYLLGAVLGVALIRLLIPQLGMPDARSILLQFYSDPRWLDMSTGPFFGPMRKNKRLIRWCRQLAAAVITLVYGKQPNGSGGWTQSS